MNGLARRLLFAASIALILHGTLLWLPMFPDRRSPASSRPLQRITVSLGSKKETATKAPTNIPIWQDGHQRKKIEIEKTREKTPLIEPKKAPPPKPKPALLPKSNPSSIPEKVVCEKTPSRPQEKKAVPDRWQETVGRPPLTTQETAPQELPGTPHPAQSSYRTSLEEGHSRTSSAAARIFQRATPVYRRNPPPKYPRRARRRGIEGVVQLEVLVDTSGKVADIRIDASSGHATLDQAALKAVRHWRFIPGTIDGHPRQMWIKVPIRFQLQ